MSMLADVVSVVSFLAAVVIAFVLVCGGGWIVSRRWDRDLAQLERPVPYTGPERRTEHTVTPRPSKVRRPLDVYDAREVDA